MFRMVHRHYAEADQTLKLPSVPTDQPLKNVVIVPIARLNRPAFLAVRYARSLSAGVMAIHVASDPAKADEIEHLWQGWAKGVPLTIIESPYRSLARPLLHYLMELKRVEKADVVTVVLQEYNPDSWWEHILHGQTAQFLKLALLFKPGFVVVSVPFHESGHDVDESVPLAEPVHDLARPEPVS
jgi:hypothetical protein